VREGRPSFTAAVVSAARGVASIDPLADALLPWPFAAALRAATRASKRSPWVLEACNAASLGLVDHLELRTRAIDDAVRTSTASGTRQLVILGAGLDARAWRMPELSRATVFEIDHPATQTYKRARTATRAPMAKEVRFVPVDFERERLSLALEAAGHDRDAKTFWIWEGVTPYLFPRAIRASLLDIAVRSALGSRLAVTYGTPRGTSLGGGAVRLAQISFRAIGEPLRGLMTTDAMASELVAAGFDGVEDTSPRDWRERYAVRRRRLLLVDEHLAIAEKRRA
jgi:methyltransferase (TIGR00027 family)